MPDVTITVLGREFPITCGEGEEQSLLAAAALLESESRALMKEDQRLTELKTLLMAGLVLADRTEGLERDLRAERDKAVELEKVIASLREERMPAPAVPEGVLENLSELAARSEVLATMAEEKAAS